MARLLVPLVLLIFVSHVSVAQEEGAEEELHIEGYYALEFQGFFQNPQDPRQASNNSSLVLEAKMVSEWVYDDNRYVFNAKPFYRLDEYDHERTHFDLREFNLLLVNDDWDLRVGTSKVFWGAMETVHWVDIINQTDFVEGVEGEDKLGQPMINYNFDTEHGWFEFYYMPYFRKRTFPGIEGRPRNIPFIDGDEAIYESSKNEWHPDLAMRWSNSLGDADVGISQFYGTTREPSYVPVISDGEVVLHPFYEIIYQLGLDLTLAIDDWLVKCEALHRHGQQPDIDFQMVAAGFENTRYGWLETEMDLGFIFEGLYDSRGSNPLNPYEHDVALGTRLTVNDINDVIVVTSLIIDLHDSTTVFNFEGSRRIGDHWKMVMEGRSFWNVPSSEFPLNSFRNDNYFQIGAEYHF